MQDLMIALQDTSRKLNKAIDALNENGKRLANAEREYRIALAKKLLQLKDEKCPVTLSQDLARGDKDIADLRFNRDVADANYKATQEAINVFKLELRIIENQISREYVRRD